MFNNGNVGRSAAVMLLISSMGLLGCMNPKDADPNRRAKIGAGIGVVTGAILGHQFNSSSGKIVGAIAGSLLGGFGGHYMDKQEQEFQAALAAERKAHQIEIKRLSDDLLMLSMTAVAFKFGRSEVPVQSVDTLDAMARVLRKHDTSVIHVMGHTDNVGSPEANLALSKARADAIADYLVQQGIEDWRLRRKGVGDHHPVAGNDTSDGRRQNRRVELYIRPLEEGNESVAFELPADLF